MLKICYYLTAIGETNYEKKIKNLIDNINILTKNTPNIIIDLVYNCYEIDKEGYLEKIMKPYINGEIYGHIQKGILVELWLSNKMKFDKYDYMIFILDDVQLALDFKLHELIEKKNEGYIDIISPCVFNSSHKYMHQHPPNTNFAITGEIELYCYIMTPKDFENYKSTLIIENPWSWGNNSILRYHNFKLGIDYKNSCKHLFRYGADTTPHKLGLQKLMEHNGFKNKSDFCNKCPNFIHYFENF